MNAMLAMMKRRLREGVEFFQFLQWEADRQLAPCDDECQLCHCVVESLGAERFRITTPTEEKP